MLTPSFLHGYTLMIACTKCGLRKRIPGYPTQGAFMLGDILTSEHMATYGTGCLRCGTHRFEVLSAPPQEPPPPTPTGWAR